MSKTVIISGSRSIKQLPALSIASINRIIELGFQVIVGDAPGVDSLVLNYLKSKSYHSVTVYYALFDGKGKPRNTAGYPCVGVSGNYRERDKFMCSIADYGLAIWDGKSTGTAENINRVQKTRVIWAKSEH
jgi:adenine-specific DNA-methyltransferase